METNFLHDKYGLVVRVSPNELAFNSAQAWEDIYGYRHGQPNTPKDPIHAVPVQAVNRVTSMQNEPNEASHARQKRSVAYSYSAKALLEQEHIIKSYETKLVTNIKRLADEGKEFGTCVWLNFIAVDIIGDLAFNEHFHCLDEGRFQYWVNLVFKDVKGGALTQATRRCTAPGSILQKSFLKLFGDIQAPT